MKLKKITLRITSQISACYEKVSFTVNIFQTLKKNTYVRQQLEKRRQQFIK